MDVPEDGATLLANGASMPLLALGTWTLAGRQCYDAVLAALRAGYRHVDTAQAYQNEELVGGLRARGVCWGMYANWVIAAFGVRVVLNCVHPRFRQSSASCGARCDVRMWARLVVMVVVVVAVV